MLRYLAIIQLNYHLLGNPDHVRNGIIAAAEKSNFTYQGLQVPMAFDWMCGVLATPPYRHSITQSQCGCRKVVIGTAPLWLYAFGASIDHAVPLQLHETTHSSLISAIMQCIFAFYPSLCVPVRGDFYCRKEKNLRPSSNPSDSYETAKFFPSRSLWPRDH